MGHWSVSKTGNDVVVRSPYNKDFAAGMKELGGTWNKDGKHWVLPLKSEDEARTLAEATFGQAETGEDPEAPGSLRTRVAEIIKDVNSLYSGDTLERIVAYAYHYGREEATREVCQKYNAMIGEMRERAKQSRYPNLVNMAIGTKDYVPLQEYSMPVTREIGKLKTDL